MSVVSAIFKRFLSDSLRTVYALPFFRTTHRITFNQILTGCVMFSVVDRLMGLIPAAVLLLVGVMSCCAVAIAAHL